MMSNIVVEFLKKNTNLIKKSQFQELYTIASPEMRVELTNFFLNAKINILPYMSFIPSYYAIGSEVITEITIPYNIKSIKTLAFDHYLNLEKIIIENGVKLIDSSAFENCISLNFIELGDNLEVINENAFLNCQDLKSIILPKSLKRLKYGVFRNCYQLKDIHYKGNKEDWARIDIDKENYRLFASKIHCLDGDYIYDN